MSNTKKRFDFAIGGGEKGKSCFQQELTIRREGRVS